MKLSHYFIIFYSYRKEIEIKFEPYQLEINFIMSNQIDNCNTPIFIISQ